MNKNADVSRINCMHRYQCPIWCGDSEKDVLPIHRKGCTHEGRVGDCPQYIKMQSSNEGFGGE